MTQQRATAVVSILERLGAGGEIAFGCAQKSGEQAGALPLHGGGEYLQSRAGSSNHGIGAELANLQPYAAERRARQSPARREGNDFQSGGVARHHKGRQPERG